MSKELTNVGQVSEDVRKSQELSGQGSRNQIPFVPIITINNKHEKKMAVVDGQEMEVEVPIQKGFIMNTKSEQGEYEDKFLSGDISGVILKERYMIEKKWVEGEDQYRSEEFDDWNELITLYYNKSKKEKFTGTYAEIRDHLPSSTKTVRGKEVQVKDYSLYVLLYINLEDSGTIARLKLKMTADNKWFDYKNEFNQNETWAGFLTHFRLVEKKVGDIDYYYVNFERGEAVDLSRQLPIQLEINDIFQAIKRMRKGSSGQGSMPFDSKAREDFENKQIEGAQESEYKENSEEEISINEIPF
jgi:hypothetical protein